VPHSWHGHEPDRLIVGTAYPASQSLCAKMLATGICCRILLDKSAQNAHLSLTLPELPLTDEVSGFYCH
jgi:hypothetical protein